MIEVKFFIGKPCISIIDIFATHDIKKFIYQYLKVPCLGFVKERGWGHDLHIVTFDLFSFPYMFSSLCIYNATPPLVENYGGGGFSTV